MTEQYETYINRCLEILELSKEEIDNLNVIETLDKLGALWLELNDNEHEKAEKYIKGVIAGRLNLGAGHYSACKGEHTYDYDNDCVSRPECVKKCDMIEDCKKPYDPHSMLFSCSPHLTEEELLEFKRRGYVTQSKRSHTRYKEEWDLELREPTPDEMIKIFSTPNDQDTLKGVSGTIAVVLLFLATVFLCIMLFLFG